MAGARAPSLWRGTLLSHSEYFYSRFAKVNSHTNLATYVLVLVTLKDMLKDWWGEEKHEAVEHKWRGQAPLLSGGVHSYLTECFYQLVLESQLPQKFVNLLCALTN